MAKAPEKAKNKRAKPSLEEKRASATGLFILCYSVTMDREHQVYIEVRSCRNGAHHVRCPGCGFAGFLWGDTWRKVALRRAEIESKTTHSAIYPAFG